MKILHICMAQYSDGWTYQENLLAKYHKCLGNEVAVLTSMLCYKEGKLVEDEKNQFTDINGVNVIRLKRNRIDFMGKLPRYKGFYRALEAISPDIIFSHGCQYVDINSIVKYLDTHRDVKLYVDNHADFSNSATNFFSKEVLHKIIWKHYAHKLIPYTGKFWGVMPSRVDFLEEVYGIPKAKTGLLVMGADDELVISSSSSEKKKKLREANGVMDEDFLIVTGGKIDSAKKQTLMLMEAVRKISDTRVKLLVFGSIAKELQPEVDKWVDGVRIKYIGWVKPENSYDCFAMADLVCFPGRHSVFWEQVVGQGIPMLVKDWPGTHHVDLGGNVRFLTEDNALSIQKEIERIINNPEDYERMKAVAKEKGMKEFSYREIAKKSIM